MSWFDINEKTLSPMARKIYVLPEIYSQTLRHHQ